MSFQEQLSCTSGVDSHVATSRECVLLGAIWRERDPVFFGNCWRSYSGFRSSLVLSLPQGFALRTVASMDKAARKEISTQLEVRPIRLDPVDTLPFCRPRLAWCSEELHSMDGLELWEEADYARAYAQADPVDVSHWIKPAAQVPHLYEEHTAAPAAALSSRAGQMRPGHGWAMGSCLLRIPTVPISGEVPPTTGWSHAAATWRFRARNPVRIRTVPHGVLPICQRCDKELHCLRRFQARPMWG